MPAFTNAQHLSAATASPEWLQVRDRYVSHIMGCRGCYAPRGRYCPTGADLRQRYDSTPLVCQAESEHQRTNWIGIEADYRAGVLPLRFLTTKYGRPLSEISLRAKRDGWSRSPFHQETRP